MSLKILLVGTGITIVAIVAIDYAMSTNQATVNSAEASRLGLKSYKAVLDNAVASGGVVNKTGTAVTFPDGSRAIVPAASVFGGEVVSAPGRGIAPAINPETADGTDRT